MISNKTKIEFMRAVLYMLLAIVYSVVKDDDVYKTSSRYVDRVNNSISDDIEATERF